MTCSREKGAVGLGNGGQYRASMPINDSKIVTNRLLKSCQHGLPIYFGHAIQY